MSSQILQRLHDLSEPFPALCVPWDLRGTPNLRSYPSNVFTLVAQLRQEFSDDELRAAKVLTTGATGDLVPARSLTAAPLHMLFLRPDQDSPPHDIVTENGSLQSDEPPCFSANADHETAKSLDRLNQLFLVRHLGELAILRRIGFPVSLTAGLESISGPQLRRLCGDPPQGNEARTTYVNRLAPIRQGSARSLVFVACDLRSLFAEVPESICTVATRLSEITRRFNFLSDFIKVWRPADDELVGIYLAAELRDKQLVRDAMMRSLEVSTSDLGSFFRDQSQPEDVASAELALRAAIRRSREEGCRFQSVDLALHRYNQLFESTVVEPLLERAAASDAVERPLWRRIAHLTAELHSTDPLLTASETAGTRDDNRRVASPKDDAYKLRRELFRELADLYRLLQTHSK